MKKTQIVTIEMLYYGITRKCKSKKQLKHIQPMILMAIFHTFPDVLIDLDAYFLAATAYVNTTTHLAVSTAKLDVLNALMTGTPEAWDVIYPASVGDNSTHNNRTKRNILIGKIEHTLLDIYDNIPADLWTVDDRSALRRPLKATTHTHSTAYGNAPTIEVYNIQHLGITLKMVNPSTPGNQHLPAKQHMHLETFVGAERVADADIKWEAGDSITHFLDSIHYSEAQVGMTAYFRVCYESTRGERSGFSNGGKVIIA